MTKEEMFALLKTVPALRPVTERALVALAGALAPNERWYPARRADRGDESDIDLPDAAAPARCFGVILEGRVRTTGDPRAKRVLGPASLLGEESVAMWEGWPRERKTGTQGIGRVRVHALSRDEFTRLRNALPDPEELLAAVRAAHAVAEVADRALAVLRAEMDLEEVPEEYLFAMLEGADVIYAHAGDPLSGLEAGVVPDRFYIALPSEQRMALRGSAVPGLDELLRRLPLERALKADADGELVQIQPGRVRELLETGPDLVRAIRKATRVSPLPSPPPPTVLQIVAADGVTAPLRALADLLSQGIATHLYDRVLLMHVGRDGAPSERGGVVHRCVPRAEDIKGEVARWAQRGDVVLLEASSLAGNLGREPIDLSPWRSRVLYLIDREHQKLHHALVGRRYDVVPSALLPDPSPGLTISIGARWPAWPPRTVRLRVGLAALAEEQKECDPLRLDGRPEYVVASFQRWARAATGRRVGVALGAGGAYGYANIPLLRGLAEQKIPIDLVSGSSFGAVVGAYYAGLGARGLDKLTSHWFRIAFGAAVGILTTRALEAAIATDLQLRDLNETDLPFFPVVTDADTGWEWSVRQGTLAFGVRASGSMPPFAPTLSGSHRYLDGALVAAVPARVLVEEGASVIIAGNVVPSAQERERAAAPRGVLEALWRESRPSTRIEDAVRSTVLLIHSAGKSQRQSVDVLYEPVGTNTTVFSFHDAKKIVGDPDNRRKLERDTLPKAGVKWRRTLNRRPPDLFQVKGDELSVPAGIDVETQGEHRVLTPVASRIIEELADFLDDELAVEGGVEALRVTAPVEADADAVVDALVRAGVAPERLSVEVRPDDGRGIRFLVKTRVEKEMYLLQKLRDAKLAADLKAEARRQLQDGDVELARLLALEAAAREQSLDVDALVRSFLELPARRLLVLPPLGKETRCVAVSPTGDRIATGGWCDTEGGPGARVHDAMTGAVLFEIACRAGKMVYDVAWAPAGDLLAITGDDASVRVFDTRGGCAKEVATYDTDHWNVWGVAFSPDGRRIIGTRDSDCGVGVWTLETGAGTTLGGHEKRVTRAAWSPDGTRVATASEDGRAGVFDAGGAHLAWIEPGTGPVWDVAWSPDGARLALTCGREARLYDAARPDAPPVRLVGHLRTVLRLAFDKEGARLATTSEDGSARVWDARTGALLAVMPRDGGRVLGFVWSPLGELVLTWGDEPVAYVWDVRSSALLARLTGHGAGITRGACTPDGTRAVTGSKDGTAAIWVPATASMPTYNGDAAISEAAWWAEHPDRVLLADSEGAVTLWPLGDDEPTQLHAPEPRFAKAKLAWSRDGARIAWGQEGSSAVSLAHADGGDARVVTVPGTGEHLRWSADGRRLAVAGRRQVCVVDAAEGGAAVPVTGNAPFDDVTDLAWYEDRLAVATWRGVYVLRPGTPTPPIQIGATEVWGIAWSPGGDRLAVASNQRRACVYDAATGACLMNLSFGEEVRAVAWSPTGHRLAVSSTARWVRLYDGRTFARVGEDRPADWHTNEIHHLAWSPRPDAPLLASGSNDGTVRLFDDQGGLRAVLKGHAGPISRIVWSADGKSILTAGEDGTARVQPVDREAVIEAVRRGALRQLTPEERATYLGSPP